MAVRDDFSAGEVLAAADLNDTFASKLDVTTAGLVTISGTTPILTLNDTDTGADSQISGSGTTGSLLIRADQNAEANSTAIQFWIDGSEKMTIETDGEITGNGVSLASWQTYTPTVSGTGWAIGNGTSQGFYCKLGKMLFVRIRVQFGSTSTFGAGGLVLSLPETAAATGTNALQGRTTDASLGEFWRVLGFIGAGGNTITPHIRSASDWEAVILSNRPFTYQTSDVVEISGVYEMA